MRTPRTDWSQVKYGPTGNRATTLDPEHKKGHKVLVGSDPVGDEEVYLLHLSYVVVLFFIQVYKNESLGPVPPILFNPPVRK